MIARPQWKKPKAPYRERCDDPLNTGHALVDAIHCVKAEGFLIDPNWRRHPLLMAQGTGETSEEKKGKANLTHQLVWAYLVDMYVPIKWRDDESGEARYRVKFDGEMWCITYAKLARELGVGKDAVVNAIEFFSKNGLVDVKERPDRRDPEKPREKPFEVWPIPEMVREVTGRGNVPVELSEPLDTGNWVCNELAQIQIEGDVIDYNWLGHPALRNKAGHSDGLLLIVLAHLFFWHKPSRRFDEFSHKELPRRKKFDGDVLYKAYLPWSEEMGLTPNQLRRAVSQLAKNGVITFDIKPIIDRTGQPTNNKVLIWLVLDQILDLTYGTSTRLAAPFPGQKLEAPPNFSAKQGNVSGSKGGGRSSQSGGRGLQKAGQRLQNGGRGSQSGDGHSTVQTPFPTLIQSSPTDNHQESESAIFDGHNDSFDDVDDEEFSNSNPAPDASVGPSIKHQVSPKETTQNFAAAIQEPLQPPLPATATPAPPASRDAVRKLEARLLEFARANQIALDEVSAARIVASWPAATMSDGELIERLTTGHSLVPLNKGIGGMAAKLVREIPDEVRWTVCTWPGYDESRDDYYEAPSHRKWDKSSIFISVCRDPLRNPPASWLYGLMADVARAQEQAQREGAEASARAFWKTLSDAQKKALDRDVMNELKIRYKHAGIFFDQKSPEFRALKTQWLNDPKTREWLMNLQNGKPLAPLKAVAALAGSMGMEASRSIPQPVWRSEGPQTPSETPLQAEAAVDGQIVPQGSYEAAFESQATEDNIEADAPSFEVQSRYSRAVDSLALSIQKNVITVEEIDDFREKFSEFDDSEWSLICELVHEQLRLAA